MALGYLYLVDQKKKHVEAFFDLLGTTSLSTWLENGQAASRGL
jgi:hypothetical protein